MQGLASFIRFLGADQGHGNTMQYEVEEKFLVMSLETVEKELQALDAVWQPSMLQVDDYFAHPCRDFALTDEAIRIRQVGIQSWLTYKGPKIDAVTKTRRELDLPLPSGEAVGRRFAELLTALGFRVVGQVRKRRLPGSIDWEGWSCQIALDEVAGLGEFLELELIADVQQLGAARAALASLVQHLGLRDGERRSYLELLGEQSP